MVSIGNLGVGIKNIRSFTKFMRCLLSVQPALLVTGCKSRFIQQLIHSRHFILEQANRKKQKEVLNDIPSN